MNHRELFSFSPHLTSPVGAHRLALNRIVVAFESSGLSREDYVERVQGRDEATNALVAEALAQAEARAAKEEALLRAYTLSGQASEAAFAEMYGMNPRQVSQQLERARRRQGPAQ